VATASIVGSPPPVQDQLHGSVDEPPPVTLKVTGRDGLLGTVLVFVDATSLVLGVSALGSCAADCRDDGSRRVAEIRRDKCSSQA
jgi:hypothetical protein